MDYTTAETAQPIKGYSYADATALTLADNTSLSSNETLASQSIQDDDSSHEYTGSGLSTNTASFKKSHKKVRSRSSLRSLRIIDVEKEKEKENSHIRNTDTHTNANTSTNTKPNTEAKTNASTPINKPEIKILDQKVSDQEHKQEKEPLNEIKSGQQNGQIKTPESEKTIVYEKTSNTKGDDLVSIKPDYDYDDSIHVDEQEKRRYSPKKQNLVSGREPSQGWERSGIRFAPLNVPLKRRLQTLVVLLHTLMMFILVAIYFFCAANPLLWPILLPYTIYILFSSASTNGLLSQRSDKFRNLKVWSLFGSYFPARLHRTEELTPTRKYVFGYHPHGIISHGAWSAFATEALGFSQLFPGITNSLLTLDSNFRIPLYRDYLLRLGLSSVSRESCINLLSKGGQDGRGMGKAITIVIGGARESLETHPGTIRLVLKCRRGFIKMAVTTGSDLVPVLCFGENDIYDTVDSSTRPWLHKFQIKAKDLFGFTAPLFHARGVFNYDVGIMPYRRPMNIVVGKPIRVNQQTKADPAYVEELQNEYIKELNSIWNTWKDKFSPDRKMELQIVA